MSEEANDCTSDDVVAEHQEPATGSRMPSMSTGGGSSDEGDDEAGGSG